MENVKQYLFDTLVEEFNNKPGFLLAKTLFLFCHYNPSFELPGNVMQTFINGLLEDEIRAFSLRYKINGKENDNSEFDQEKPGEDAIDFVDEMKKDIYTEIAAENLSRGTGKVYSPSMVKNVTTKFKKVLSYNDILEIFILSGR